MTIALEVIRHEMEIGEAVRALQVRLNTRGTTKFCSTCRTKKSLSEFNSNRANRDGKCLKCRACQSTYHREYYLRNPEKFAEKHAQDRIKYADRNREYRNRADNKVKASQRVREWHQRNPDAAFEWHKKKYETVEGRAYSLVNAARKRIPEGFTLTIEHVVSEIAKGFCPVTGIAFDLKINTKGKNSRSWSPYAPSVDKIDPNGCYTNENTRVVIWQYNLMKHTMSDADVLEICRVVVARNAT